jgi:xanthine dehydrogenase YagS FAD-binding subunit
MQPFTYTRPETIDEAIRQSGDETRYFAGGTDLLTLMKRDIDVPGRLVDLKRLPELDDEIVDTGDGVEIGALATLSELERHPLIRASYPALAEAAAIAATPQLRNMATIGGNLLQRPRCWYFRSEQVTCWLRGGDTCYAREGENQHHALFGESPCVATHPSDPATALLALDAAVTLRGAGGERMVPIGELFAVPEEGRRRETTLTDGEIVTKLRLPGFAPDERSTYRKAMDRKVWAFALVGVAARVVLEGDRVSQARLVLGGVAPVPWRVEAAEGALVGSMLDAAAIDRAAEAALAGAIPLEKNAYKIPLAKALVRRALEDLASVGPEQMP